MKMWRKKTKKSPAQDMDYSVLNTFGGVLFLVCVSTSLLAQTDFLKDSKQ